MGSETGAGWRAKWSDLDLEEKVKINNVFDMFLKWFLMALRDVISMVSRTFIMVPRTFIMVSRGLPSEHSGLPVWRFPNTVVSLYGIFHVASGASQSEVL